MKLSQFKKLNSTGVAHLVALLVVVVGAGIVGTYLLVQSHADSSQITCNASSTYYGGKYKEYNCKFYTTTPVVNTSMKQVGTLHSGTNWVLCQVGGLKFTKASYYNNWWAYTKSDQGTWGWVNGVYGMGGANTASAPMYPTGSFAGVPQCYLYGQYQTSLHTFASPAPGTLLPGNGGK